MAKEKVVYATAKGHRLGAQLAGERDGVQMVSVWVANGGALGFYRLDRFRDGKLTAATLRDLFEGA
jgi:hypothetical protein